MTGAAPQLEPDIDEGFLGVNMRQDPGALPAGYASEAINMRFTQGIAAPRHGIRKMPWTNIGVTDPAVILPLGTEHGSSTFRDPFTDTEWIIIAAGGKAYRTREGMRAVRVPLPGQVLQGRVSFTQCMNVLVMHRGVNRETLVLTSMDEGFKYIAQTEAGTGTEIIPNAESGMFFGNRLWIPSGDLVSVSDYLDYTRYAPILSQYFIEKGDGDKLVGLYKFNDSTVIAFKTKSVHVIANLIPDAFGNYSGAVQDRIVNDYGCKARRTIVAVGSDVWFLADQRGVVSIRQTETNKLQGVDVPLSDAIEPLIRQIDWAHADNACAAYWDNKVYFAVPIGNSQVLGEEVVPGGREYTPSERDLVVAVNIGTPYYWQKGLNDVSLTNGFLVLTESGRFDATTPTVTLRGAPGLSIVPVTASIRPVTIGRNNAVLVWDTVTKAWAGVDKSDGVLGVASWILFNYTNKLRLGFVSHDGYINLFEDGFLDDVGNLNGSITRRSVSTRLVTRGYHGSSPGRKSFRRADLNLSTWWPQYTLGAQVDGVNESQVLGPPVTKDRLEYYTHGKADYDPTNAADDHSAPYREDYSVSLAGVVPEPETPTIPECVDGGLVPEGLFLVGGSPIREWADGLQLHAAALLALAQDLVLMPFDPALPASALPPWDGRLTHRHLEQITSVAMFDSELLWSSNPWDTDNWQVSWDTIFSFQGRELQEARVFYNKVLHVDNTWHLAWTLYLRADHPTRGTVIYWAGHKENGDTPYGCYVFTPQAVDGWWHQNRWLLARAKATGPLLADTEILALADDFTVPELGVPVSLVANRTVQWEVGSQFRLGLTFSTSGVYQVESVDGPMVVTVTRLSGDIAGTVYLSGRTIGGEDVYLVPSVAGALAVDGLTLAQNEKFLCDQESDPVDNGVYRLAQSGTTSRSWMIYRDRSQDALLRPNIFVAITEGTLHADTYWRLSMPEPAPWEVGVTPLTFSQWIPPVMYIEPIVP